MAEWEEWALVEVDGGVFTNVKELELYDCPKLKGACLPDYLPSLETLRLSHNDHLVASLSRCRYPSLCLLRIEKCLGIKSFPGATLPSNIQRIQIKGCDELVSLSEEGWPSNLKSLEIYYCEHAMQWNLGMLTSLTSLRINNIYEEMDAFPKEEGQLPTTLTSLKLSCLRKLKSLNGSALRHLTSLQHLTIYGCDHLQCLPQERLPESLSELFIYRCPLLKPRCQRGIGEDWPKISHIPSIIIDYKVI